MGRMESEGGVHFERQGLLPPPRPWGSCEGGRPPLCSLNIVALPAQDEPTCISGLPSEASSAASIFLRPLDGA
jgi:hypothetical protein